MVKVCLKRPQCGRHPKKFPHIDTNAARYVMVLGGKVVELCTEEVQKPTKERVRRERETPIDVSGKQDTLTRSRLRLRLSLQQTCRSLCNQPGLLQLGQILLRIEDRIQSPWIQPGGNPERDDDPRLGFLPFAAPVAFLARSSAAVLSFTMVGKRQRWRW